MKNGDEEKIKIFNAKTGNYEEVERIVKSEEEWETELDQEAYHVTREHGTERPFSYCGLDQTKKGIYQCVACGTDLFDSQTKFDSGTGWPSFYAPVAPENVETQTDNSLLMNRTEVHCPRCNAHLGHVFPDGPPPTGLRFCI